ncbi:MAG: replicative DNA helicase [Pseudobdellovibrionaceae bacterium]
MTNIASLDTKTDSKDGKAPNVPFNLEAEQGLLGALLMENRRLEDVAEFLRPDHFYAGAHKRIYDAIRTLVERGQAATPVTLKSYFEKDKDLESVGGAAYLAELAATVISLANTLDYARTVYDLHLRRELINLASDMIENAQAFSLDSEAIDTIEKAEKRLYDIAETGDGRQGFVTLKDSVKTAISVAEKAYNTKGHVTGVTTGLTDMDKKLGGLHGSDLLILAARPSMGKTALAVNVSFNAAKAYAQSGGEEGAITAFFSLEMSHDQLTTRILADQSNISGDAIRKGAITQDQFREFAQAAHTLTSVPLYIDDTPALTIGAVRARARRLKRQHGLGLIVVDYLQLLRGSGSTQSESNRVLEISEITRGLKALAKELEVPVIALSQLSRAVESRDDKRPQLSDLRESGSIEQDADVVMFIYREEYYLSREEPSQKTSESVEKFNERYETWSRRLQDTANIAEVIVAKQRHGPIGPVKLYFDPNYTRFSDLEQNH